MSRAVALAALAALVSGLAPGGAEAHRRLTDPELDAALAIDAASGRVLYARNEDLARHPASLTKMMTLYLLFEALRDRSLTSQTLLIVSENAASQPRAHLKLRPGSTISVQEAIEAIVVCSANDVAVVVAEALGGNEARFAQLMNAKARALGMTHTVYRNASGLPDDRQITTASDLALLARHLMYDFPQDYAYFGTPSMNWRGTDYNTHNFLIGNYPGADGIKTGYIDSSGYSLVASALRGKRRVIAVLMGGLTPELRDEAATDLLDNAFAQKDVAEAR